MKTYRLNLTDEDGMLLDTYELAFSAAQVKALLDDRQGEGLSGQAAMAVKFETVGMIDDIGREIAKDLRGKQQPEGRK